MQDRHRAHALLRLTAPARRLLALRNVELDTVLVIDQAPLSRVQRVSLTVQYLALWQTRLYLHGLVRVTHRPNTGYTSDGRRSDSAVVIAFCIVQRGVDGGHQISTVATCRW